MKKMTLKEAIEKQIKDEIKSLKQRIREMKKLLSEPMNEETRNGFKTLIEKAEIRIKRYEEKL